MKWLFATGSIFENEGLLFVRICTGLFMAYHGWEVFDTKKMNSYFEWDQFKHTSSTFLVYAGKITELVEGILLIPGLFTRFASLMIFVTMLYISML